MTSPVSRRGDSGPAVAEIRDRLGRVGLLPPADPGHDPSRAVFDDGLDHAVRAFQQGRGLTVDGVVGPQTFRRLEEARWVLGDRVLSYSPGHLVSGDDVLTLQHRLSGLGFDLGRVDGVFGAATDAALREFQRSVGVDPDGTCGPETFRALSRLGRSMSGGTSSAAALRELHALDALCSGVADKVVVVDPGHGGDDDGLRARGLTESVVCGDLAARVEGRLAAIGVQVLLTRDPDAPARAAPDERSRAAFANETGADLVLSLHVDSVASATPAGCASFYYGDPVTGVGSALGARFAEMVQDEVCARTDLTDCRTHAKTWDLLRMTRMPAVRVECGYLSSPRDAARLADAAFRDALAEGIASACVRFFAPDLGEA